MDECMIVLALKVCCIVWCVVLYSIQRARREEVTACSAALCLSTYDLPKYLLISNTYQSHDEKYLNYEYVHNVLIYLYY